MKIIGLTLMPKIKPKTGSAIIDVFLNILIIIMYPLILIGGLLVMAVAWLLSLFQKPINKPDIQTIANADEWRIFLTDPKVTLYQKFEGSLPWDSGDYLQIKSDPEIEILKDKLFGDWCFKAFNGIFLQQWHDKKALNCSLIFIDANLKVTEVKDNIQGKNWTARIINDAEAEFTFIDKATTVYCAKLNDI